MTPFLAVSAVASIVVVWTNQPQRNGDVAQLKTELMQQIKKTSSQMVVLDAASLLPLMRQSDVDAQVSPKARALIEEGRRLLLVLDHTQARDKFTQALALYEQSYVRYYDPADVAQLQLLLGVSALQMARPDLARDEFRQAQQLDPSLKLDAHYSPQVRAAFDQARTSPLILAPPSFDELSRLCRLAQASHVVVVSSADANTLTAAIYDDHLKRYQGVEVATPLDRHNWARRLAQRLGIVPPQVISAAKPATAPPAVPHVKTATWYRRWYVWVAVGAAVSAAVVLPLTLRSEDVDATFRW